MRISTAALRDISISPDIGDRTACRAAGCHWFSLPTAYDMQSVIYGKLLLNLNNALNAVADQPIKTQLRES